MFTYEKLMIVCCAAVFAFALAACGGGDDDDRQTQTQVPAEPAEPTKPTPVATAVDLSGVAGDATVAPGTADIPAGESADIGEIAFACDEGGEDCSVAVDADGNATSTGGTVTAANSDAYDARKAEEAVAEAARIEATTKASATKRAAIGEEAAQTNDAGLGGSAAPAAGNPGAYAMSIERDGQGTTVTVALSGAADDDPKFEQRRDLGDGRKALVRLTGPGDDGKTTEEVVVVGTDIEPPAATPFAMVDGQQLDARDLDPARDSDGDGNNENDFTALAVDASDADVRARVMSDAFATGTAAVLTFARDDRTTAETDEAAEVAGRYNGAPGTYRCDGAADCTVTADGQARSPP